MTQSKPRLGYLGLGLMGSQMSRRLIGAGYSVAGYDPDATFEDEQGQPLGGS